MPPKLELKTAFAFKALPIPFRHDTHKGLIVRVESDCVGRSSQIASDIGTALDYGAMPAAHEVMLEKIRQAEKAGEALRCSLEYGP